MLLNFTITFLTQNFLSEYIIIYNMMYAMRASATVPYACNREIKQFFVIYMYSTVQSQKAVYINLLTLQVSRYAFGLYRAVL